MQKDFITVTPDSGSGNTTVTVSVSENLEEARESLIMVTSNGITRKIIINQEKAVMTKDFVFIANPEQVLFKNLQEEEKHINVTCEIRTVLNGTEVIEKKPVDWNFNFGGDTTEYITCRKVSDFIQIIYQGADVTDGGVQGIQGWCTISGDSGEYGSFKKNVDIQIIP